MTAPFEGQGEAAVCARVALAWIRYTRAKRDVRAAQPLIVLGIALEELRGLELRTMRLAFFSLCVWIEQKRLTKDWLAGVLYRDLMRYDIRRCYYADYKATRRDPRVTNRGVGS
jgi:hypothetical protein